MQNGINWQGQGQGQGGENFKDQGLSCQQRWNEVSLKLLRGGREGKKQKPAIETSDGEATRHG
jgi:hypothetical protein